MPVRDGSDSDCSSRDGCASKKQRQAGKKTAFPSDLSVSGLLGGAIPFRERLLSVSPFRKALTN